jgi:putative flippase GtrA
MSPAPAFSSSLFAKFVSTNAIGTAVDTAALWLLATFVFESQTEQYVLAPILSFELAVLNNFSLSCFWIWKGRVQRTFRDFARRFLFYNLNSFLVFLLKLLLLLLVAVLFQLHVVYCNLIALSVTGLANFLIQDKLIFSASPPRSGPFGKGPFRGGG